MALETAEEFVLPDDLFPWEQDPATFAGFDNPNLCRGCGGMILPENRRIADCCPCNSRRGINHGLVPRNTCTCFWCDPQATGSTRIGKRSPASEADRSAIAADAKREVLEEILREGKRRHHLNGGGSVGHTYDVVAELHAKYATKSKEPTGG